jgi:molybdopterin synthase catalytic subunit
MRVTLLAFGILRDHLRNPGPLDLPAGSTVRDVVERCRAMAGEKSAPWSSIAVAVNQEYVPASHRLADGDEVALLPPVSGGSGKESTRAAAARIAQWVPARQVFLTEAPIDAGALANSLKQGMDGAVVVFDGIVRDNTRGRRTLYLFYEAYGEMAVAQMKLLAGQAFAEFRIRDIAMVHRIGRLEIGETSVAIAVASAHRGAAFEACRWLIDTLKQTVPIWKKEFFEDGAVWAQGDPFPTQLTAGGKAKKSAKKKAAAKKSAAKKVATRKKKPGKREGAR